MQILTGSTKWGNLLKEEWINVRRLGERDTEEKRQNKRDVQRQHINAVPFLSVSLSLSFLASALITEHQESKEQLIHQHTTAGLLVGILKRLSNVNTDLHKMTIKMHTANTNLSLNRQKQKHSRFLKC